ncbi:hypothetical protein [Dactylosporangium sp. CA-233914]|uniref:hypothetical protein n=1 Tax=Dactylosporangium sp. CA-233914 TaxID=3239934 RepID=UPI003D925CF9
MAMIRTLCAASLGVLGCTQKPAYRRRVSMGVYVSRRPEQYDEAARRFGGLEVALLPARGGAAA